MPATEWWFNSTPFTHTQIHAHTPMYIGVCVGVMVSMLKYSTSGTVLNILSNPFELEFVKQFNTWNEKKTKQRGSVIIVFKVL